MAQTSDAVFPAASDYIRNTSPDDESSDADYYGEFQGTIKLNPTQNDTDCYVIREESDRLVVSETMNDVNVEKVIHSVVAHFI